MTDDEVRALVRDAIFRHLGAPAAAAAPAPPARTVGISFERYAVLRAADDGRCLIEPAVRCNQCGFCECHGH